MENNNLNENEETNLEDNNIEQQDNKIEKTEIVENSVEEQKEDKKNNILIISIIGILILLIGGYFVLSKVLVKEDNKPNKTEQKEEKEPEEEKKEDEEELNYTLNVYKYSSGAICNEYNADLCKDLAFTIKTKTETAKVIKGEDAFVLYEDDGLRVYNNYDGKITKLNLENQYSYYYLNYKDNKILGILYVNQSEMFSNKGGYYNIAKSEKMYNFKYDNIILINDSNYLSAIKDKNVYLLSANEEKEELVSTNNNENEFPGYFYVNCFNNKCFYYVADGDVYNVYKFYSNDKKVIFDKKTSEGQWSFKDKYLYIVDNKVVKKYDIDGTLMSTSKAFNDVKGLIENYAVYVEDGNLSLINIDNDKSVVLDNWNEHYYFDTFISGYYTREKLDNMGEKNKPEGIYVVMYSNQKIAENIYGKEYCYTKTGEVKTFDVKTPQGGRAKPVLYLYPTKTTDVKVEFEHPEYLTTTYPKYNNFWKVKASPNGDLIDSNNKYYYGLYWDEIRYNEVDFHEGFYVTKDNAIDFLEEKLDIIGLNPRERNEFIMYWLPILENNEKSIVYFELTKERERGNKLIITPKPDSMLRVSIHIKKVNNKVNIKEQKLETFKRSGFSAIEWGGMTY